MEWPLAALFDAPERRQPAPTEQTPNHQGSEDEMPLTLSSPAFSQDGAIPRTYTCEGEDISPPLDWTELPEGTKSLALVVDDPDAPDPKDPKRTWVHWVVFNISPDLSGLDAGASAKLPGGAKHGLNDWKRPSWGGPCPPIGRHRYFFKVYALDTRLDLEHPTKTRLLQAIQGHVLAKDELMGTYEKEAVTP